jgi:hypothetical protein
LGGILDVPHKKQINMKKRRTGYLETAEHKYYIFCEGEKTEPNYLEGFKRAIESNAVYKNTVFIKIKGVGKETLRVLDEAKDYVEKNKIREAQVWCVYDKDSFPAVDFNAVAQKSEQLTRQSGDLEYNVAWSNQCVEYWFILHFSMYESDNNRRNYRKHLNQLFKDLGYKKYQKNNKELFYILTVHGDPKKAIKRAEERLKKCEGRTDADSVPATKVHLLVKELARLLPEDIKKRYL